MQKAIKTNAQNFLKKGEGGGAGGAPVSKEKDFALRSPGRGSRKETSIEQAKSTNDIFQIGLESGDRLIRPETMGKSLIKKAQTQMHPRFQDSLKQTQLPKSILQPKEDIEIDMDAYQNPSRTATFARPQTAKPSDHPGFGDAKDFTQRPQTAKAESNPNMDMLRSEIQAKVSEAWNKKLKTIEAMQAQQDKQRQDLNEQTVTFKNALSQSLSGIAADFVTCLEYMQDKVTNLEGQVRQSQENEKLSGPDSAVIQ